MSVQAQAQVPAQRCEGAVVEAMVRAASFEHICRARDLYLSPAGPVSPSTADFGLRPTVLESWQRSLRYGLDPTRVATAHRPDVDLDSPLTRVVDAVVAKREVALDQSRSALVLTDREGNLIRVWVQDTTLGRWFETHDIVPTFSADETVIGTSSGSCLLSGKPMMVRGPEHFGEVYFGITSTGAPIIHPVTRRLVGSLNLTCRYEDTSPVLLSWVTDLVQDVERALQYSATRRERLLLDAYLAENGDARHPLVALNEHMIITNATAARLLESVDQALLWEHACRSIQQRWAEPQSVVLADGTVVSVVCHGVMDAAETIGAVLKIQPASERPVRHGHTGPAPVLGQLAGNGPRWRELCRQVEHAGNQWAMLTGERGTGKLAVARAMAGDAPVQVIDAADAATAGAPEWLSRLRGQLALALPGTVLVIRHADDLDLRTAVGAARLLSDHRDGPARVIATSSRRTRYESADPLLAEFALVIGVPALRDRLEDLPTLLDALTAATPGRPSQQAGQIHWITDAVQALTRLDWPGNVAALEALVRNLVHTNRTGYISANDLPPDVLARASRRKLAGLEQAEATAIMDALRAADGNKNRAAASLGIARSTLYRKMRALGIDLSTMAF